MIQAKRFGNRVVLPSIAQITHDLKNLIIHEDARRAHAVADGLPETASWDEIGTHRAKIEAAAKA